MCEASESVSAASVPNCGIRLYLASSVYLSDLPKMPTLTPQSWLRSLGKRGVPAATPTGVTEHPGPRQPALAAESTAHADRRLQVRPGIFYFISGDGEHHVTHTVSQCVYICVSNYSLYESAGFLCPSVDACVCVWMVTLVSTLTSGVSLTSHHTNRPIRRDRRHHSNR